MFDLAEKRLVWIPIRWKGVKQTSPDALAEPCEHAIELKVEILDNDALAEAFGAAAVEGEDADAELPKDQLDARNLERFKKVVHDWRNIVLGGQPAEFNDENIARLLKQPLFIMGYETCYLRAWGGQLELAEKNSASSSDSGQPGAGGPKRKQTPRSKKKPNN